MKKKSSRITRWINLCLSPFLLAFSLVITQTPIQIPVYAAVDNSDITSTEKPVDWHSTTNPEFDYAKLSIVDEAPEYRTATMKTFALSDGSYRLVMYDKVVHYQANGQWKNIDNSLKYNERDDEYGNQANTYLVKFPKKIDDNKKIKLTQGNYSIDWTVNHIQPSRIKLENQSDLKESISSLTTIEKSLLYEEIMDGIDLEYVLSGADIKENIYIDYYRPNLFFDFDFYLKNLKLVQLPEGTLVFTNDQGETIYQLGDLYMSDGKGQISHSISVTLTHNSSSKYSIRIQPDDQWLKQASYPVLLDPSLKGTSQYSIQDTYVDSSIDTNFSSSTIIALSGHIPGIQKQGLLNFSLPSILANKQITNAYLSLTKEWGNLSREIGLYKNNSVFDVSAVKWSTRPSFNPSMIDYHIVDMSNIYRFNITEPVREWQQAGYTLTPGFTIKDKQDVGIYNSVRSTEYSGNTSDPVIEIGFIDPSGIKDYWTYASQEGGVLGTGYVSDFSGHMSWVRTDLNFSTDKQILGYSMAFNSLNQSVNNGYGFGWNINYHTKIGYDTTLMQNTITDYTGNKVYYKELVTCESRIPVTPNAITKCFLAEDGSKTVLVIITNGTTTVGQYTIDAEGNKQQFDNNGNLTSISNIQNALNLTINRQSYSPYRITSLVDSSGNKITFSYGTYGITSSSLLIIQPDNSYRLLEQVNYTYSYISGLGKYMVSHVGYKKNYDRASSLQTADDIFYSYDSLGRMTEAYQYGRNKITYTYVANSAKVASITKSYNSNNFSLVNYTYNYRETKITDQTGDFIIYKFDDFGHTVNAIDDQGNTQFWEYINLYQPTYIEAEDLWIIPANTAKYYRLNHLLISQSNPQSTVYNPVINPGFEFDGVYDEADWRLVMDEVDEWDHEPEFTRTNAISLFGKKSGQLQIWGNSSAHLEQTVALDPGVYTITGYILNDSTGSNNVKVKVVGQTYGGSIIIIPNNHQWQKVSFSFGVTSIDQPITIWIGSTDAGIYYADSFQIVEGFIDTRANLADNPSFEVVQSNGNVPMWTFGSSDVSRVPITNQITHPYSDVLGDYALQINGSPFSSYYAVSSFSEFMNIWGSQEAGSLIFGGWAKSEGTPSMMNLEEINDWNERAFRIRIDFLSSLAVFNSPTYESKVTQRNYIDFNSSIEGWQYNYKEITLPQIEIYWVNIVLEYQGEGTVYFDGLQIYLENNYTHYQYNAYGQIEKVTTSSSDLTEYIYDLNKDYPSNPIQINLSDGSQINLTNGTNETIDEVIMNNVTSTPTYNSYGQVTQMTIGNSGANFSNSTSFIHNSQYVGTTTNEFGKTTNYYTDTYTGLMKAIENAKGQDTHHLYDNEGRLIKIVSVDHHENYTPSEIDAQVEYQYDSNDRLWKIIMSPAFYYSLSYDNQGRLSQVKVNDQPLMSYSYVMEGSYYTSQMDNQTYGNGDAIKFVYNDQDQVSTIQFKDNNSAIYSNKFSYDYDQSGNIAAFHTFGPNNSIEMSEYYTYDAKGHLIQSVDTNNNTTKYLYDESGNLTSLYFQVNDATSTTNYQANECFAYNANQDCTSLSSLYDKTSYTAQGGTAVTKDYHYETNALYRLSYIQYTLSGLNMKQNYLYQGFTSRVNETNYDINNDATIDYSYKYTYDELGNITSIRYFELGALKSLNYYEYDSLNQLVLEDIYYSSGSTGSSKTLIYNYDSHGNRTVVKTYNYGDRNVATPIPSITVENNGFREVIPYCGGTTYTCDSTLGIKKVELGSTYPSLTLRYKDIFTGTFYSATATLLSTSFSPVQKGFYQSTYRAVSSTNGIDVTFNVTIQVGTFNTSISNPLSTYFYSYNTSNSDQLISYNSTYKEITYSHDYTYDLQGNPLSVTNAIYKGTVYPQAFFSWDGRQLAAITYVDANHQPVVSISYRYNDQGYRTQKSVTIGGLTTITTYYLVGDQVVYETNGINQTVYTYDFDGTLIGFSYDADASTSSGYTDYFYVRDLQGNIMTILNNSGLPVVKYAYDSYGNLTVDSTTNMSVAQLNPYTYRGYRYDSDIGMYYLNSRYYNPDSGRFLNADGLLGQVGDILSTNMYAYTANNPVMYSDITGYAPEWLMGIGRIATGVFAVVGAIAVITSGVALAPMIIIATITLIAGGLTIANGIADIQQFINGNNYIRDSIFKGDQSNYNLYAGITEGIAIVGSIICGGWLKYNQPRIQAYKNVGNYGFSNTLSDAEHMARPWQKSIIAQRNVIKYGSMVNEAGSRYKFVHEGWKLVVNIADELILHFGPF